MKNCFSLSKKTKFTPLRWKYSWDRSLFYLDKKRWTSISSLTLFVEQNAKSPLRTTLKKKQNCRPLNKISPLLIRCKSRMKQKQKKNHHSVTAFKARCSSIVHYLAFRRFRSMSWSNSSINLFPIWFSHRINMVSVYAKKSICVFCVEEEKIRLTVLFRSAADKCSAPLSSISSNWR